MNKYNESYIALVKIASELVSQGNNDNKEIEDGVQLSLFDEV